MPPSQIQCCVREVDEGDDEQECELLTPATCQAVGGTNIGAGTCDPDPCPPPKIRCCVTEGEEDEEGENDIECKQRTPEKCARQGGVNMGPGSCDDGPCGGDQHHDKHDDQQHGKDG